MVLSTLCCTTNHLLPTGPEDMKNHRFDSPHVQDGLDDDDEDDDEEDEDEKVTGFVGIFLSPIFESILVIFFAYI